MTRALRLPDVERGGPAEALERRADRSPNPTLATVLRGRAAERRGMAGRLRAGLAVSGVVPSRRRSQV